MIKRKIRIALDRLSKNKNPFRFIQFKKNDKQAHRARRKAKEARFRFYGLSAILVSLLFLCSLFYSIISEGYSGFLRTEMRIPITFDKDLVEKGSYRKILRNSMKARFPDTNGRKEKFLLYGIVSKGNSHLLGDMIAENPSLKGKTVDVWLIASSLTDMFMKGKVSSDLKESLRKIKDIQIKWLKELEEDGNIRHSFNTTFFTSGDSREPEQAGILGSLMGSLFTIAVCMLISFPIGVGAAVYLEEFAPKNRITDIIEVNINNLAAVPSIIFGLLALSVYLNFFGLPRSSSLVGGLALSMLVLPTIVITARNAIKAVPPSIRFAATALGATKVQVTIHHTIPYALPGIMTGTILGVARALGETAPLLMIGMVAFIADVPSNITDPATSLPTQIYLWVDSPEMGFVEKTSACIIVLLVILGLVNALAAYIRKKFEYDW